MENLRRKKKKLEEHKTLSISSVLRIRQPSFLSLFHKNDRRVDVWRRGQGRRPQGLEHVDVDGARKGQHDDGKEGLGLELGSGSARSSFAESFLSASFDPNLDGDDGVVSFCRRRFRFLRRRPARSGYPLRYGRRFDDERRDFAPVRVPRDAEALRLLRVSLKSFVFFFPLFLLLFLSLVPWRLSPLPSLCTSLLRKTTNTHPTASPPKNSSRSSGPEKQTSSPASPSSAASRSPTSPN